MLVKESSVRTWKNKYLQELALRKKTGKEMTVKTVAIKKSGRPLLLGEQPGKRVQAFLLAMREGGAVINTAITIACALGVLEIDQIYQELIE